MRSVIGLLWSANSYGCATSKELIAGRTRKFSWRYSPLLARIVSSVLERFEGMNNVH